MDEIFFQRNKNANDNVKEEAKDVKIEMKDKKGEAENKYKADNLDEGLEKQMEEKLLSKEENQEKIYGSNIEYDMKISKQQTSMKKEDKYEMEKMRRWIVRIYSIYVTPLNKMFDPFLQFTIGGDYFVEVYKTKSGSSYKVPKGSRGYSEKTEVQKNVDKLEKRPITKEIDIEMRMSYSMVTKQKMMVEVWDYYPIWMNEIQCYSTVPLISIVDGDCNVSLELCKRAGKKRPEPFVIVDFKCTFQEIWDFKLNFLNWKSTSILPPKKKDTSNKKPSSKIEISLLNTDCIQSYTLVTSEESKNTENKTDIKNFNFYVGSEIYFFSPPMWPNFTDLIVYRGTYSQLENELVLIKLYDTSGLFKTMLSKQVISLRGILETERIKTDLILLDEEKQKYNVTVEGFVNIPNRPKYRQSGENVVLLSKSKYLCIRIMRVENIRPPEIRGIVDSFISVEWCGLVQRTRTVKENNNPTFDETLYFQVPMNVEYIENPEKYIQKINDELASKAEVTFNLMIEGDDNTYDNLGISFFHLSSLKETETRQQRSYFADDLRQKRNYISRIYTGKNKLTSAFSLSNNTYVHYEAWFLQDFPELVDFGEKKKASEKGDKIPNSLLYKMEKEKERGKFFIEDAKRRIEKLFESYTSYPWKERQFFNLQPMDQYKNKHFLPYYLSMITMPRKLFSKEDELKDPNFFDCNLTTLDEIAHYVRCIPFNLMEQVNEVWASPDFTLKLRKGGLEDHAILMASLMMGLKQVSRTEVKTIDLKTTGHENTMMSLSPEHEYTNTEKASFPYENRVFVCLGKLKTTRDPYVWVMTLSDDYRTVNMWDPKLFLKYEIQDLIEKPDDLSRFLKSNSIEDPKNKENSEMEMGEKLTKKDEKVKKKEMNEPLKGLNEDSIILYQSEEDNYKDEQKNEIEELYHDLGIAVKKNKDIPHDLKINRLNIDDKILIKGEEGGMNKPAKNEFLEEQKKEFDQQLKDDNVFNFLPKEKNSNKDLTMPYETIDVIFNRNNVYFNMQYHNPQNILYNIQDSSLWKPLFFADKGNQFKGTFEPFYSMTNFGPTYSPGLVNRMKETLIKEMRVGITAARSGKNLQTKFKKKTETVNTLLQKFIDKQESLSLGRVREAEFKKFVKNWENDIRTKMPAFYRMEAYTVFFNFNEPEIIRRSITEDLEKFYTDKTKHIVFATSARVFPYLNNIVSVRIILAKFKRISSEDIDPSELEEYKKTKDIDPTKPVEEEKDSDEEDDALLESGGGGETATPTKGETNETPGTKEINVITIEKK